MVSGHTNDPAGGEAEDRTVQIPDRHEVKLGWETDAEELRCQCSGS